MSRVARRLPLWCRILPLALLLLALSTPSWANLPSAGQHYPNGVEDFVVGALPPPGVYLKNYFGLIQKDRLKGTLPGVSGSSTAPVDFEADVTVVVPRFIWVTPQTILGASYGVQIFLPMYWADVRAPDLEIDHRQSGLGDIIVNPLILGWHFGPNFHMVAALDIWVPTGDYDREDPATQILSKNHWTFEPVVAVTYLHSGFDFSAKLMYDFNTKNDDYILGGVGKGELEPGQEFHVDYAISYARKEGLRYGISGYSYWQTTKDEFKPDGGGPKIKGGRGEVHALGPTVKYWPDQGRFSAVLKHHWEFGARHLPEGQATWLNVVWAF
ncbi:MAG: transporter [Deferrisomatales bacterium]|nr:transporter [Deferrisomatales bacterium]